ncbi:RagB/SusD family nutrient uptake outer membrane protein [Niastella caeni]|uniref:RagB/SusD family nutrient uptake outer membrane protein n=1 Tax=Niastella caeni TaxID=2569763 RepID=A0A4V4H1C4_9BACT|nr:RagB/SusD family nutrient uptake outer membrane protein [Niastella caeni]THU39916.1 RagB/SusD family nutrient uptake outer membrane protein [Niastella caeni]
MYKQLTYFIFYALLLSTAGCKKFLEKNPDNRASINTPEQVSQLLGTAYPQANYMAFTESISDNVTDKGSGGIDKTNIDPYFFRDVTDNQQDSPEFYWNACYTAIAAANQALEAIRNAPDTSQYNAQKGEALVCRAYAHFMLVTFFSKVYTPGTAASDLGIPYVTVPENVVFKKYDRRTVASVYQMIEQDLTQGLPLIDDTKYTIPRYHFTKAAANAFAARFYLFKQDYAKVVTHANLVFAAGNITSMLRPWNTTYRTMTPAELFAIYQKATEPANLLLCETGSVWGRNYYTVRYSFNSAKRDEILGDNVTGGEYAFIYQVYTAGTNNYVIPKINEYFVRSSVNANIGLPYVMVPLFTTEEVLFNRIEANIAMNNTNATNAALADLNTYASTRINNYDASMHIINAAKLQSYYGSANLRNNLLNALMDFKRAEYVQEGMRWFDLLRHNRPVTHTTTDGQTLTLPAGSLQRVFQLPESVSTSGMPLNPR